MTRPRIFNGNFWVERVDAATDGLKPFMRRHAPGGAISTLTAISLGETPSLNAWDADWILLGGYFVGGFVLSILMSFRSSK